MEYYETIFSLVKNYFSLDARSLKYFEKELFGNEMPEFYKDYFIDSPDLRKSFDITNENRERIDPGWIMFQDSFPSACIEIGIEYKDFRDNKKSIEKNTIKMKKILMDYYISNPEKTQREFNFRSSTIKSPELHLHIDDFLSTRLELIGQKKLPSIDLKLVVSNNFADWFMSSTSENWSSCLNFRSEFSGAYWAGLPGLIGDKNRTMVYITDGNKKEYYGIETEKFINRSFGLLDIKDKVFLLKFYPLKEMLSTKAVQDITGLPITQNFDRTKYPIVPLFHKEPINKSCFIYQDETNFYHDEGELFLVPGEREFYWYEKGSTRIHTKQFLHYKKGLSYLIDNNTELSKVQPKYICGNCSKHIMYGEDSFEYNGTHLCVDCNNKLFKFCSVCGKKEFKNRMHKKGSDFYCINCYKEAFYKKCDLCGEMHSENELFFYEGQKTCIDCSVLKFPNKLTRCSNCGKIILRDELCPHCEYSENNMEQEYFDDEDEEYNEDEE